VHFVEEALPVLTLFQKTTCRYSLPESR